MENAGEEIADRQRNWKFTPITLLKFQPVIPAAPLIRGWLMPGPRGCAKLAEAHPRDWQKGPKCPAVPQVGAGKVLILFRCALKFRKWLKR